MTRTHLVGTPAPFWNIFRRHAHLFIPSLEKVVLGYFMSVSVPYFMANTPFCGYFETQKWAASLMCWWAWLPLVRLFWGACSLFLIILAPFWGARPHPPLSQMWQWRLLIIFFLITMSGLNPVVVTSLTITDFDLICFISTFGRKAAVVTNVTTADVDLIVSCKKYLCWHHYSLMTTFFFGMIS